MFNNSAIVFDITLFFVLNSLILVCNLDIIILQKNIKKSIDKTLNVRYNKDTNKTLNVLLSKKRGGDECVKT